MVVCQWEHKIRQIKYVSKVYTSRCFLEAPCSTYLQYQLWRTKLFQCSNKVIDQLNIQLSFQPTENTNQKHELIEYGTIYENVRVYSLCHSFLVCPTRRMTRVKLEVTATDLEGIAQGLYSTEENTSMNKG